MTHWLKKIAIPLVASSILWQAGPALAQTPSFSNPFYITVGYSPGGASDRAARFVADQLQERLKVNVVVENRTGAGGRIAAQYLKNQGASKDIMIMANPATMVIAPLVINQLNYDPAVDFKPVSVITDYTFGVAVAADSPLKTMDDLMQWVKDHPNDFNVAVPASGSLPHFFALMLAEKSGVDAEVIGYRGSAPALNDLIGGTIPVAIDTIDVLTPQHKGGRVRVLATSGVEPDPNLEGVPTLRQSGLDIQASGWNTFYMSAAADDAKITYLGDLIKDIMSQPEIQERFKNSDLPPVAADRAESTAIVEEFKQLWTPIIQASGYKVNE